MVAPSAAELKPIELKALSYTPEIAACPRCGAAVVRHEVRCRPYQVDHLAFPAIQPVYFSCFLCRNHPEGQRWFTALPPHLEGPSPYPSTTRARVTSLVERFKMSFEAAAALAQGILHLPDLHPTTVMRWVRDAGTDPDTLRRFEEEAVLHFSGQLAVDEVYDGPYAQLKATDPVTGWEVAYELIEGAVCHDDVVRFFERLKGTGFHPKIVVTDGSRLYPVAIATVWPEAEHQLCVFHFLKGWNEKAAQAFWAAFHTMPAPKKRGPGRPKKRGRPREDKRKREHRDAVREARFLVFRREDHLTDFQRGKLQRALDLCPPLRLLRRLVLAVYTVFAEDVKDRETAEARRQALLQDPEFQGSPVASLLEPLRDDALFRKLTVSLAYWNADRTSNDVERKNREFRKRQKGHYRLRSLPSLCALLDLVLLRPFRRLRGLPCALPKLRLKPIPERQEGLATA